MTKSVIAFMVLSVALAGCLEDDPNYKPSGGASVSGSDATGSSDTTAESGSGTATGTTDTGTTDTGTTGPMCDPPMESCDGSCVDTSANKNHCGVCFNKCQPAQEQCLEGQCVPK